MKQDHKTTLSPTRRLVEAALLVAVATVLSMFKLSELPYGGSITLASMLPILLIAYRSGILWGLGSGLLYGAIQQLLGLKTLSYVTSWYSVLAVILLDYLIAFAVIGFGGIFRGRFGNQRTELTAGAALACLLRYTCHVVSGATVWAGLSIPTGAALAYSFIYNATYMLPESIILVLVAFYLGALIDFRLSSPTRFRAGDSEPLDIYSLLAGGFCIGALIFDIVEVFSHLQNSESGEFDITGLAVDSFAESFWMRVLIVSLLGAAAFLILRGRSRKQ